MCLTIYLTSITPLYKNNVVVFTITVSEMASKCILHIPCNFSMNSLPLVSFLLYLFLICCFEELNLWLRVESKCNSEILKQCRQTFACYLVKDSPLFFLKFKKWAFLSVDQLPAFVSRRWDCWYQGFISFFFFYSLPLLTLKL